MQLSDLSVTFSTISEMVLLTIFILFQQGTVNGITQLPISCEEHITRKINMEDLKFCGSSAKKK